MHIGSRVGPLPWLSCMAAHDLKPVLAVGGDHRGGCQAVQPAPLGPPRPNPDTPCIHCTTQTLC